MNERMNELKEPQVSPLIPSLKISRKMIKELAVVFQTTLLESLLEVLAPHIILQTHSLCQVNTGIDKKRHFPEHTMHGLQIWLPWTTVPNTHGLCEVLFPHPLCEVKPSVCICFYSHVFLFWFSLCFASCL